MADHTIEDYKGYMIQSDGYGFYTVYNPRRESIGTCEGRHTAREMVEDHIAKVYAFWNLNCVMSPLVARAARTLTNEQAERILAEGPQ